MPPPTELRFARRVPEKGPPEAFTLASDSYVPRDVFIARDAAALWNLSKGDELRLVRTLTQPNGYVNESYEQFHDGYPVENGRFTLTVSASGKVMSAIGDPVAGLEGIATEVRVSEASAVEQARRRAASACSLHEPLTFVKAPPAQLRVSERHRRLVWQTTVVIGEPKWVEWGVQIDSATGEVLHEWGGVGVGGQLPGCSSSM